MKKKPTIKATHLLTILEVSRDPRVSRDALRFYLEVATGVLTYGSIKWDDEWAFHVLASDSLGRKKFDLAARKIHRIRRRLSDLGYIKFKFVPGKPWGSYSYTVKGLN